MKAECVYFIMHGEGRRDETHAEISIQSMTMQDGKQRIPFFTSLQRLQEFAKTAPEGQVVQAMPLAPRDFLEYTKDMPPELMVNPGSLYGKFITKAEVALLLDAKYSAAGCEYLGLTPPNPTLYTAAGDGWHTAELGKMRLRKPNPYPEALVATLAEHFKSVDDVEAAYVMHWCDSGEALPHMLIGLDAPPSCTESIMHGVMPKVEEYTKEMAIGYTDVGPLRRRGDFDLGAPFYTKA
jgi:hypothetical protein